MRGYGSRAGAALSACLVISCAAASAADWPTYQHDNYRSARTQEKIAAHDLAVQWVFESPLPPAPAWYGPAKWDAWRNLRPLRSMRDYDPVFHVIVAGDSVYFGSSVDDSVHCLDAGTGEERWTYCTDGPVRIAPTYSAGNVYLGSDDGHAYCVRASDGQLVWKFSPTEDERLVLNNGRLISFWPCRTGVLIKNGTAYFAASMLPWKDSYLCSVDAKTGRPEGPGRYVKKTGSMTVEGALLASASRLIVPQGRAAPKLLNLADGESLGALKGGGGCFVIATENSQILHGPGNKGGWITQSNAESRATVATFKNGNAMVVSGGLAYILTDDKLSAVDRSTKEAVWEVDNKYPYALMMAADTLFVGGEDEVAAIRAADGALLWKHAVAGKAHGLAVANGALLVSTDTGGIYSFRPEEGAPRTVPPALAKGQSKEAINLQATKQPQAKPSAALACGPSLRFVSPDSAVVRWQTEEPCPTVLEYQLHDAPIRIEDLAAKTEHEVKLTGLKRNRTYSYVVKTVIDGVEGVSAPFECDTFFNYSVRDLSDLPSPYLPDETTPLYARAAEEILSRTGVSQGICLILGVGEGRLACELAKRSRLRVIGVDSDSARVASASQALREAGMYGDRITVRHIEKLEDLPFPEHFANLIVSQSALIGGECVGDAAEVFRLLRPLGGVACIGQPEGAPRALPKEELQTWLAAGSTKSELSDDDRGLWALVRRDAPLPGAGEWSHQYGRADNSAFGGETLRGATRVDQLEVQWLGRPGPRYHADRQGRKPSPLYVNGRLFLQGLRRIVALDAYNGFVLWSLEIPALLRMNMPHDSSNWCADNDHVFAAITGKCWRLDADTGKVSMRYDVIPGLRDDWDYDWGYVARYGDAILGSAVKKGTAHTNFFGQYDAGKYDGVSGEVASKVCSENIFAIDKQSGETTWTYADGLIINSTITIHTGRVYFVETRNAKVKASDSRRVYMPEMWLDQFFVALDAATGETVWEKPIDTGDGEAVMYLAGGADTLILVSSGGPPTGNKNQYGETLKQHYVYACDPSDGDAKWETTFEWTRPRKGEHMQRPAIVGDTLFIEPHVVRLSTGEVLSKGVPVAGGCGTYAATANGLILRSTNVSMWDAKTGRTSGWKRLRSSCWLSTIPAGGMILSPEGGGGCTCGLWMETSIAFAPVLK